MITKKTLLDMANEDGLTLKKHQPITYKTGYQVATEGIETKDADIAIKAINAYNGDCGVWKSNGIYYIDKSKRVQTKAEALKIGKECNQISVLKWDDMSLIYC